MPQGGHASAGRPGDAPRPDLQPAGTSSFDDDELPVDEHLDRLLGDEDLLLRLQLSGYAAYVWQPVSEQFARYGVDVIRGWLRTNKIFTKVFDKTGNRLPRLDQPFDEDAVETLTTDVVVIALDKFLEQVLKRGRWNPSGGASLKTFFIGQCCFQFSNVYRKWLRAEQARRRVTLVEDITVLDHARPSADTALLAQELASEAMQLLSTDVARRVASMIAVGYTHAEIARLLDLTDEKAVENLLGYQRRRIALRKGIG